MLPEQAQFRTQDPATLNADLDRAYRAIREEFRLAGKFFAPGPTMVYQMATTYQAQPWDCFVASATCSVLLPQLGPESAGVEVAFIRRGGTLTVASDTTARVQNGASEAFTTERRIVYQFDGADWWR